MDIEGFTRGRLINGEDENELQKILACRIKEFKDVSDEHSLLMAESVIDAGFLTNLPISLKPIRLLVPAGRSLAGNGNVNIVISEIMLRYRDFYRPWHLAVEPI